MDSDRLDRRQGNHDECTSWPSRSTDLSPWPSRSTDLSTWRPDERAPITPHSLGRALLLGTVLVTVLLIGAVGQAAGAQSTDDGAVGNETIAADAIGVSIGLQPNGTAFWTIRYRYQLETANESRGFQRLRQRIASRPQQYLETVRSDVETAVVIAENETGRSMALVNLSVATSLQTVPREVGIVEHHFLWTGFARTNATHVQAGDAIREFTLGPRTELRVTWPPEYEAATLAPKPARTRDGEATWVRSEFDADEPRIVLARTRPTAPVPQVGLVGLLVVVAGVGAVVYVRRSDRAGLAALVARRSDDGVDTAEGDGRPPPADDPPPQPLSTEERVTWVLEANGGRVKQQTLAQACDWSASKTSRVVRQLEEDGVVDLFRIGRENVVALPDVDPIGG